MTARRHHVVPRFYLAGFTDDGKEEGRIVVFDRTKERVWTTGAVGAAIHRDFYRVSELQDDPLVIEDLLSRIEAQAALRVREIVATRTVPTGEERLELLFFIACLHARTAVKREEFGAIVDAQMWQQMQEVTATDAAWARTQERMREAGVQPADMPTQQEARELVETRAGKFRVRDVGNAHLMMRLTEEVYPHLARRNWYLLSAADEGGGSPFVTSDSPVAIAWTSSPQTSGRPGFATPNTDVTLPLSSELALVGRLEEDPTRVPVATLNGRTLSLAAQAYSPLEDFAWLDSSGVTRNAEDFLASQPEKGHLRDLLGPPPPG